MSDVKKIRITKASMPTYWYADRIGEIFEVTKEMVNDCFVKVNETTDEHFVSYDDCEPVIEHEGRLYREVQRKANIGDLVKIILVEVAECEKFKVGDVFRITGTDHNGVYSREVPKTDYNTEGYLKRKEYVVLEPIDTATEEPPGPHASADDPKSVLDLVANLARRVTELEKQTEANTNDIAFLDKQRLESELTPLQLAILRADAPTDVKFTLIVEAERLQSEREQAIKEAE
ncbi:hypothetical protein WD019_02395 [Fictibacillus sp. Mic-4]|uniref:hypothetical protein n=1 Tax=Fictibacillus sp. Mic-4 TaxID=3132826 RepID=UPI003CE8B82D